MNKATIFLRVTSLSSSEVSFVFIISSSHANTNLPNRRFSHEQLLMSKYSSILHALLHSQFTRTKIPHIIVYKNPNHLIFYTHSDIHHYPISVLNYIYFHSINTYIHTIHAELKVLFDLPLTLN